MAKSNYPVKRGSRFDRLSISLVYDKTIDGMNMLEGVDPNEPDETDFTDRSADYVIGHLDVEAIHMYCRIVVYSTENGNGKRGKLSNMEGDKFIIPFPEESRESLANGYYLWLKMDEAEQKAIDDMIIAANDPLAPRHILPKEQLTDKELSDPNS